MMFMMGSMGGMHGGHKDSSSRVMEENRSADPGPFRSDESHDRVDRP